MFRNSLRGLLLISLVTLSGCFSSSGIIEEGSGIVDESVSTGGILKARIPSKSLPGLYILIKEHKPQTFFADRGFSYTATLESSSISLDVVTLPIAREDIFKAGKTYCGLIKLNFSHFFTFQEARPGGKSYTMYFNCG